MKHMYLGLLLTIVWAGTGCDAARTHGGIRLEGSGKTIERTFAAGAFDKLDAEFGAEVTIVAGSSAVRVEADDNIMEFVEIETVDGTLRIGLAVPDKRIRSISDVTLKVEVPSDGRLEKITASGSSKVTAEPVLTASEIEFRASGASRITAKVACDACEIKATGASGAVIDGTAGRCEAEASGASKLSLAMQCTDCAIECSGASEADLAGTVRSCTVKASGASAIRGEHFAAAQCRATANGASSVRIQCTEKLQAQASGASRIVYSGTCTETETQATGASSVSRK